MSSRACFLMMTAVQDQRERLKTGKQSQGLRDAGRDEQRQHPAEERRSIGFGPVRERRVNGVRHQQGADDDQDGVVNRDVEVEHQRPRYGCGPEQAVRLCARPRARR